MAFHKVKVIGQWWVLLAMLLVSGCSSISLDGKTRGDLLKFSYLTTVPESDVNAVLDYLKVGDKLSARYDVDAYRITYATTDPQGRLIAASGLLTIPDKDRGDKSPLIAYHHGTIFHHDDAPSENGNAKQTEIVVASLGFIISSPDYIGYGVAEDALHPYLDKQALATASIDMLRASRQFLAQQGIELNDQLFLSGYSEGGFATLATQQAIQQHYSDEFEVDLSLPGGGAYNLLWTVEDVLSRTMSYPAYVGFTFKAYNDVNGLNQLDKMFNPQYVQAIDDSYRGKLKGGQINDRLTTDPKALFSQQFLNDFYNGGETRLRQLFAENSMVEGWVPSSKTLFYHGEQDITVPIANAEQAVHNMKAQGGDVGLVMCQALGNDAPNHDKCSIPYALFAIATLSSVAEDL